MSREHAAVQAERRGRTAPHKRQEAREKRREKTRQEARDDGMAWHRIASWPQPHVSAVSGAARLSSSRRPREWAGPWRAAHGRATAAARSSECRSNTASSGCSAACTAGPNLRTHTRMYLSGALIHTDSVPELPPIRSICKTQPQIGS